MAKQSARADVTIGTLWQRFWSCVLGLLAVVLVAVNLVQPDFTMQQGWPVFIFAAALLICARLLWRPDTHHDQ